MPSICVQCGLMNADNKSLCEYHLFYHDSTWPQTNRIWCDYFHRGVVIQRVDWGDE